MTEGMLPGTKVSANRTGIWRVAFDAYLAALPQPVIQQPAAELVRADIEYVAMGAHAYSEAGYVAYRFETADDCRQFALKADRAARIDLPQ